MPTNWKDFLSPRDVPHFISLFFVPVQLTCFDIGMVLLFVLYLAIAALRHER